MRPIKIKPFHSPSADRELKTRKKDSQSQVGLKTSFLTRARSERNFLQNFRKRSNILTRLLRDKAKEERNLQQKIDTLERIEGIKTRNDFFSIKCGVKKQFSSCRRLLEKVSVPTSITTSNKSAPKNTSVTKKNPVPLNSITFDLNLVPDCSKKPVTFEDLESYLQSKKQSNLRFCH